MTSDKEDAIEVIRGLPDDASLAEILAEIRTLAAIRRAERDADAGRMIPHEEVRRRFLGWIGNGGSSCSQAT